MKERTLIWGSLSKTYSMTGWRVGYLAAPADAITAAVKVQQNLMLSICSFAQAGAAAALRGPQECVQAMVAEFDRRRRLILDAIAQSPGLSCPTTPRGAFYVFAKH
jgi:aspartate/methionine/tyrosine aminotransferase